MINNNFWNSCEKGTLRFEVSRFIENHPLLAKFDGENYWRLENDLVSFIADQKHLINNEVDHEYQREDIRDKLIEKCGEKVIPLCDALPSYELDKIILRWNGTIGDSEALWELHWMALDEAFIKSPIINPLVSPIADHDYSEKEIKVYALYVKECDSRGDKIMPIDYFFSHADETTLGRYMESLSSNESEGDISE